MSALYKIKKAGFEINLVGDSFEVIPASKLSQQQREFLKSHKAEIIGEIRAELMQSTDTLNLSVFNYRVTDKPNSDLTVIMPNTNLDEAKEKLGLKYGDRLLTVICYTPYGKPIEVEATSAEHAAWLLKMNPKPQGIRQ